MPNIIFKTRKALFLLFVVIISMGIGASLQYKTNLVSEARNRLYPLLNAVYSDKQRNVTTTSTSTTTPIIYNNSLESISDPLPIFSKFPKFISPITEEARFFSSPLIQDDNPNLSVRAWRYSYNARGIIEIPNTLNGQNTAIIVVHPWGIDDGQGWRTPEPAGVAFFCTPWKNQIYLEHTREVLNPFINRLREHIEVVAYSLPGHEDSVRTKLYQSPRTGIDKLDRKAGIKLLEQTLNTFTYHGNDIPSTLSISRERIVKDYFLKFNGLDSSNIYNNNGFWDLPIPIVDTIDIREQDIVFYDDHGYDELRKDLKAKGIKNILLTGYAIDKCVVHTTAGYRNLKQDFNVFIIGDATMAAFPAQANPMHATTVALANASLNNLITEISWISVIDE